MARIFCAFCVIRPEYVNLHILGILLQKKKRHRIAPMPHLLVKLLQILLMHLFFLRIAGVAAHSAACAAGAAAPTSATAAAAGANTLFAVTVQLVNNHCYNCNDD